MRVMLNKEPNISAPKFLTISLHACIAKTRGDQIFLTLIQILNSALQLCLPLDSNFDSRRIDSVGILYNANRQSSCRKCGCTHTGFLSWPYYRYLTLHICKLLQKSDMYYVLTQLTQIKKKEETNTCYF